MQNQGDVTGTGKPREFNGICVDKFGVVQRPVNNPFVVVLWRVYIILYLNLVASKASSTIKHPNVEADFRISELCNFVVPFGTQIALDFRSFK